MNLIPMIFSIIVLIASVVFHELAHGVAADQLGDPTPGLAGRLTLNPLSHLEWVGSFIVPLICVISGSGFIIGWAKPVPFDPRYLKYKRWGPALVAVAGPVMNIAIAVIGAIVLRFVGVPLAAQQLLVMVVIINITLAVFNMVPVPPLDGHHILGALFPAYQRWSQAALAQYGLVFVVIAIFLAGAVIGPIVSFVTRLLIGM